MDRIYIVRLDNGVRCESIGSDTLTLRTGDYCVIQKDFYLDYGQIIQDRGEFVPSTPEKDRELATIQRKATVHDQSVAHENEARSKSALRTAEKYVEQLALPMNLLNAHYSFDNRAVIVQFTADGRVDFRELVKELSRALASRIELRQIGVRDETAICGGIGICGQELCCSRFLRDFSSINVKMAKEQDLSLTPSTISGACGRLKCCLKYEHDGYVEMEKSMPRRGEICECPKGRGRVCDRNLLTQKVTLQMEETGVLATFERSELKSVAPERRGNPNAGGNANPGPKDGGGNRGQSRNNRRNNNNNNNNNNSGNSNNPGGNSGKAEN